ncbi:ornithine cyclodeaminase/mu-crystallin [Solidesulfovibrio fructosivorans JJ]]|uniref:Ornithine cyclodeaminase/mu-crystallin n=1 Tax=Solidesulfovibrio fructosivorans JJ] TaxID=596151 RepID=E1K2Q5_SOLFR|nr:delta(1)-pyrroline-2-carboxylate reductase family protein [Solidesulfovibrio fructosivorans]EFL49108.1 ornithine cyclodeaminase/mu-crystallin [Solidesulfovibrio fructosivorans JJ]]
MFDYASLSDAIADVLRARLAGRVAAPERLAVPVPGGMLLCMPAADDTIAIVKNITVHPHNKDLPVIQGEVLVLDAATGRKLAVLDARELTARRTAAVSLLAARLLAADKQGPLLVVGAGVQAVGHAQAFCQGLGLREVLVASRTRARAMAMAVELGGQGIAARVADDLAEAARAASMIVTATTSREPVFPDVVRDDVFVAAVGSFTPEAAEVPASLVSRATLFVDDLPSARVEAGDYLRAGVNWERVMPLERFLDTPPRLSGPVIFKTVGHAIFDLAGAKHAMRGRRGEEESARGETL